MGANRGGLMRWVVVGNVWLWKQVKEGDWKK